MMVYNNNRDCSDCFELLLIHLLLLLPVLIVLFRLVFVFHEGFSQFRYLSLGGICGVEHRFRYNIASKVLIFAILCDTMVIYAIFGTWGIIFLDSKSTQVGWFHAQFSTTFFQVFDKDFSKCFTAAVV
jgi:hypothetical protein